MHLFHILSLAISASAFLLPPDVGIKSLKSLPAASQVDKIELECEGGCPVYLASNTKNGVPQRWTHLYPGKLVADVAVKENNVLFNGQQIWPQAGLGTFTVKQTTEGDTYKAFDGPMMVSMVLKYKPEEILFDETTLMKIHPISIEILSVLSQIVHAQSVEIRVAETEHGIALLPSKITEYKASPYTDGCTNVWCRVKGTIAQTLSEWREAASKKVKGWRGCGHKKPHKINGVPIKGGPAKFGPGSTLNPNRHHEQHPHHGHHKHHHGAVHRFMAMLWEVIIFPIVLGVTAGMLVCAIGRGFLKLFRRIRSRTQAETILVEQIQVEEGFAEPPMYEEIYREPQVESEDEKKELLQ